MKNFEEERKIFLEKTLTGIEVDESLLRLRQKIQSLKQKFHNINRDLESITEKVEDLLTTSSNDSEDWKSCQRHLIREEAQLSLETIEIYEEYQKFVTTLEFFRSQVEITLTKDKTL